MSLFEHIKLLIYNILRILLRIICVFPISGNRWFFNSYTGTKYNDSPKYISDYVQSRRLNIEIVWSFRDILPYSNYFDNNIVVVKCKTILYFYYLLTSKVIIINDGLEPYIPIRSNQIFINTWHGGGAYKTCGMTEPGAGDYLKNFLTERNKYLTAFVLTSEGFNNKVVKESFLYHGKTIPCGLPRNEVLFQNHPEYKINVENFIKRTIDIDELVILFAPTFRGKPNSGSLYDDCVEELDVNLVIEEFSKRYNKRVIMLFKAHHGIKKFKLSGDFIDVSKYPDVQHLIYISHILITDYSSIMWDFGLMLKPIFMFVPDIDEYIKNRGFLTDPYSWPYVISKSNQELISNIQTFNEDELIEKIKVYNNKMVSYENDSACEKCVNWILNEIEKESQN